MPINYSESGQQTPAANAEAITPADSDLPSVAAGHATRAVYVGGTGDLAVRMIGDQGDTDVIFKSVLAGSILPIRVSQIRTTGTTATLIIAMW